MPARSRMDKPTLILIHGLVGSLRYFDPQSRLPGVSIIAEDLLGYGAQATVHAEGLTLSAQADRVAGWIDHSDDEKVWLLGHSMGGAIAVLAADLRLERVRGIINVEGNFTEKDTFWSRKIVAKGPREWAEQYRLMRSDPADWLRRCGIEPDARRVDWARQILDHQPAGTVHAMAKALLDETLRPGYLEVVRRLLDRGLPMHLIAGAKSAADWGVPGFVRRAAASHTEQPDVGHLMMLEAPAGFCDLVASLVLRNP